ncbi:transcription regulator protein BACH1 isoform 7-T10 [Molossus nigricans]
MSLQESAAFAYESSVHSANVLLSLNDQRRKDELCDITVLVEGQPFRAHRAVLAACSSYFHTRVVGQADTELSISLPEEVTVKGFDPVIQFAYTAKLCLQPQQEPCPYACVISLGDDSETDTEGDSEPCSAREQECEVKLPFNAQRIISLSRNDFQSLLKMHKLSPEQLDCIHDIRRRSKNRIAAQRCRKRKLDCIQNLESEIEKLQSEKESLLKERDHILSTLGETKQNLTGLCQQVCKEAALSQEQIQILAKYSASDCPLSFLISEKEKSTSDGALVFPPIVSLPEGLPAAPLAGERSPCYPSGKGGASGCVQGPESSPSSRAAPEHTGLVETCRQSTGISDFCQQMTDKCTTDE